jgi:hypothetical protein
MAERRRSRTQWRQLVEGWPRSGLTQQAYCERHGVGLASLRRWRGIFQDEGNGGSGMAVGRSRLVPVRLVDDEPGQRPALTVVLADGLRLEIGRGFDAPTLARLLGVLRPAA